MTGPAEPSLGAHQIELTEAGDGLLERVAVALGSTLDLREVLRRLAEIVQERVSAQRCSIVLIEGDRLEPAVAIGPRADASLWEAFRKMPPIPIGGRRWEALEEGRAVVIDDARRSGLIPDEWVERFDLRSMVIVPLLARGEPCGAMAVDWPEVRAVDATEAGLVEAIGAYAGVAVSNARLHERMTVKSRTLEHLVGVAGALNSSTSLTAVLDLVCEGFERIIRATHVAVSLSDVADPLKVTTLAQRGDDWLADVIDVRALAPEELAAADDVHGDELGPVVYRHLDQKAFGRSLSHAGIRSAALFPLFGPEGTLGAVIAGFDDVRGPRAEELEAGQTLAEMAAAAIGRADLHDDLARRVRQLEILAHLADVVAGASDLDDALDRLRGAVERKTGLKIRAFVGASQHVRESLGGRSPGPEELTAIESWRAEAGGGEPLRLRRRGDAVLVPVIRGGDVEGMMLVQADDHIDLTDEEFLLAVGAACAEILHRTSLRQALADTERRLAASLDRQRGSSSADGSAR